MEKKQLNFNAPLISVRRMSSIVAQPEEVIRKTIGKPPPNRQQSLPVPKPKWDMSEVAKPAAVPFEWEQTPGRRKGGNDRKPPAYEEEISATPKLPPGRMRDTIRFYSGERPRSQNIYKSQTDAPWNDHAALLDSLVESMDTKGESDAESNTDDCSDTSDVVSATESLSLNCSISGLSGNRKLSVDLQAKDFMMSRFLPAAKAVVLETPQYVPKKELVVTEQQPKLQVKNIVTGQPKLQVKKIVTEQPKLVVPKTVQHYSNYTEDVASETEDEVDENASEKKHKRSGRSWRIFPRLCVKNSLCLLNPLPGIKTRIRDLSPAPTPAPATPAKDVKRLTRNAYSGPITMARKAYSGPLDKQVCDAMYNRRMHPLSGELYKIGDNRRVLNQSSYSRELCRPDGLSPHRQSRSGAISPYRNVAPRSPFNEGGKFLGVPREVEKTVYVDTVNNVPKSDKNVPKSKKDENVPKSDENLKNLIKNLRLEENLAPKSCVSKQESLELADKVLASTTCVSKLRGLREKKDGSKQNEEKSKPDDERNYDVTSSLSPLPPPLPKSPSESWLWRTLPSFPLQNQQKQRSKAAKTASKWETIVKSSNLHHDHTRYSEELVPHNSRQQKRV